MLSLSCLIGIIESDVLIRPRNAGLGQDRVSGRQCYSETSNRYYSDRSCTIVSITFSSVITNRCKVMVATSGAQLLPESAVKTLCLELLPVSTILTPNVPEAKLMLKEAGKDSIEVHNLDGLKALAGAVHALGPKYVLLKGGHLPLDANYSIAKTDDEKKMVCNVLFGNNVINVIEFPYHKSENTHGTGCSLASALACNLAIGNDIVQSVIAASRYVDAGIKTAVKLGRGSGPINHFHSIQVLPFPPGGFVDYLLDHHDVQSAWYDFTHHDFVEQMADGTLDPDAFKYYMIQDYLYLIHFARANALAGYKAKTMDDIAGAAAIVSHIKNETELHINECKGFGLTQEMMEKCEESQACTAYTRYVLDIGQSEDWLALQISLLPCLLGYGMIARRLKAMQEIKPPQTPNRYLTWINNYVADDYTAAVKKGCGRLSQAFACYTRLTILELIEKHAFKQSPYRVDELVKIFVHATKMETGFWEMASTPAPTSESSKKSETRTTHHRGNQCLLL